MGKMIRKVWIVILVGMLCLGVLAGELKTSATGEYVLTDFGDVSKSTTAQQTLDKACKWITANGGGVLIIPANLKTLGKIKNTYQTERKKNNPAVTILDLRLGYEKVDYPSIGFRNSEGGWAVRKDNRLINMPADTSLPPFGCNNIKAMRNAVVRGAASYGQFSQTDVKAGKDRKIYVPSIQGLFIGLKINLSGRAGAWGGKGNETIILKDLGWELKDGNILYYVVADLKNDHPAKAILGTKHVAGTMYMVASSNCDNQTAGELTVHREQYSHGDSWVINGDFIYQGNVMSGLGDERATVYSASVTNDLNPFHGEVESVDWKDNALQIKPGMVGINKIATSRPLINMNKTKWITKGKVRIVPPDNLGGYLLQDSAKLDSLAAVRDGIELDNISFMADGKPTILNYDGQPVQKFKYTFQGKAYPSLITGGINYLGGRIIGSKDCGWTEEVVGRYFAISDPGECLMPGEKTLGKTRGKGYMPRRPVYRWYLIKEFIKNNDNTCAIKIERIRWHAVNSGSPYLYNVDNYTWDGHERPMDYIIAPGANIYDVGDAWKDRRNGLLRKGEPNTIRLTPGPYRGTSVDFQTGDPITQAVGADPTHPQIFYSVFSNSIPTSIEQPAIYLSSIGKVSMGAAMTVTAKGENNRDSVARRKDRKAPWTTVIDIHAVSGNAINFNADVTESAINFRQPNQHTQPIKWCHERGETLLTVDPVTAEMKIDGSDLSVKGIKTMEGISGTGIAARNLRGIDVTVKQGARKITVNFKTAETDAAYSINVQPNWNTNDWITEKTEKGFTVEFSTPASAQAKIDWQLIR